MSDKNTPAQTSAPNITNQDTSQPKTSRAKPKPATHPGSNTDSGPYPEQSAHAGGSSRDHGKPRC